VVVGGHFGGALRELAVLVCGRLQGCVGQIFCPGRGELILREQQEFQGATRTVVLSRWQQTERNRLS
jgi:hypothetical protein